MKLDNKSVPKVRFIGKSLILLKLKHLCERDRDGLSPVIFNCVLKKISRERGPQFRIKKYKETQKLSPPWSVYQLPRLAFEMR